MAQTSTVPVPARSAIIDNLRLAQRRAESAEWFTMHPEMGDADTMVRSLAQTAIYALQDVIQALNSQDGRTLRRPVDVTERIEADL